MSEDWDLFAVVRSCNSLATSIDEVNDYCKKPEDPLSSLVDFSFDQQEQHHASSLATGDDKVMDCYVHNELQDSCKPFLTSWCSSSPLSSSLPSLASVGNNVLKQEQGNDLQDPKAHPGVRISSSSATTIPPVFVFRGQREEQQQQPPQVPGRSRKRKNQQKRTICHVTQENLSSDMWAWRKYGQKPIKGSPYPRNYYRCSSSKGCLARKQVERSNLDPTIFIVTYTGEHTHPRPTHRNSLAGSTRNKSQPVNPTHEHDPEIPGQSKPGSNDAAKSSDNLSPTTPLKENDDVQGTHVDADFISQDIILGDDYEIDDDGGGDDDDEDEDDVDGLLIPNLAVSDRDDLFSNMQDFAGPSWPSVGSSAGNGGG